MNKSSNLNGQTQQSGGAEITPAERFILGERYEAVNEKLSRFEWVRSVFSPAYAVFAGLTAVSYLSMQFSHSSDLQGPTVICSMAGIIAGVQCVAADVGVRYFEKEKQKIEPLLRREG